VDWPSAGLGALAVAILGLTWRLLRPKRLPDPPAPPAPIIHPSLDHGSVTGEEIALAGPAMAFDVLLDPGRTAYRGEEPAIDGEVRHD